VLIHADTELRAKDLINNCMAYDVACAAHTTSVITQKRP
jgi:hypothetical protein